MDTSHSFSPARPLLIEGLSRLRRFLPPPPLFAMQPLLAHIVADVTRRRPELFARLGDNSKKLFLIDPVNMPLVLLLRPDPKAPELVARERSSDLAHDVRIAGKLGELLRLIDGGADSDALFFTRDIVVEGDTEAIVALRNAIDDMEGTLAGDVAAGFGPLSPVVRAAFDIVLGTGGNRQ